MNAGADRPDAVREFHRAWATRRPTASTSSTCGSSSADCWG